MKIMNSVPRVVWVFLIGGVALIFLNIWLMKEVNVTSGDPFNASGGLPRVQVVMSGSHIPKIDPATDLLAPVGRKVVSSQEYLKARPQQASTEKEHEMPHPGTILLQ